MGHYFIGVDLGQSRDYSTVAVVERAELKGDWDPAYRAYKRVVQLQVRKLERIALGTPYPEVAERIATVSQADALAGRCCLVVDGTGVGRPVVDLVRHYRPAGRLMPVIVTGGDRPSYSDGYYNVPKRDLIVGLQVLFQTGTVRLARGLPFAETLVEELLAMQVKITSGGKEQYGAWRQGSHDDLVFAVALACWGLGEVAPLPRPGAEEYWTNEEAPELERLFRKMMAKWGAKE